MKLNQVEVQSRWASRRGHPYTFHTVVGTNWICVVICFLALDPLTSTCTKTALINEQLLYDCQILLALCGRQKILLSAKHILPIVGILTRYCPIGIHVGRLNIQSAICVQCCKEEGDVEASRHFIFHCSALPRLRWKDLVEQEDTLPKLTLATLTIL